MNQFIKRACLIEGDAEPESLSQWIYHTHSLTDKLQSQVPKIELNRLSQGWMPPSWWDKYVLEIQKGSILQREIMIRDQDIPYWYARTVIPEACYAIDPEFFNRLEKESLRNLIFYSDKLHREHFETYSIDSSCIEYFWVKKYLPWLHERLWVRYTEYSYQHQQGLFLIEILLPSLQQVNV